jgi:hypothetical protein
VAIGFTIGIGAWIFGALGHERSVAAQVFAIGFIIAAVGVSGGIISMPKADREGRSTIGVRIAAMGFAIVAIPTAVGAFLLGKSDDDLKLFFYAGFFVMIVGTAIHLSILMRHKR